MCEFKGEDSTVNSRWNKQKKGQKQSDKTSKKESKSLKKHGCIIKNKGGKCKKCGYPGEKTECPAAKCLCNICKKIGHFASICHHNKYSAHTMEGDEEETGEEDVTFSSIPSNDNKGQFYEHIAINERKELYF